MKICTIILLLAINVFAAFEYNVSEPYVSATSGSMVASTDKYSSYLLNPALSAAYRDLSVSLVYGKPYELPELRSGGLISRFGFGAFGGGAAFSTFGSDLYQENMVMANVSRCVLKERVYAGLNFRWYSISIENYGSSSTAGIDFGLLYLLSPYIQMGFSVTNLNQPDINGISQQFPLVTRWGVTYRWSDRFIFHTALEKEIRFPVSVRFAGHLKVSNSIDLYSSMNSYPSVPALGFMFSRNHIAIHYAFQYHFDLGGSHMWGISFSKTQ